MKTHHKCHYINASKIKIKNKTTAEKEVEWEKSANEGWNNTKINYTLCAGGM